MKQWTAILLVLNTLPALPAQQPLVRVAGDCEMVRAGLLSTAIITDTIQAKHLYAIGLPADLRGEIFLWDNLAVVAAITEDTRETYVRRNVKDLHAACLLYADVSQWDTLLITQPIRHIPALAEAIGAAAVRQGLDTTRMFPFLLLGKIKAGQGEILYQDTLGKAITPEILEQAKFRYPILQKRAQLIGFWLPAVGGNMNAGRRVHLHFRLQNKFQAGHLNEAAFEESEPMPLFLPKI